MAVVLGMEIPVLEFLLILNIIMLFYVIISMFEIRSLVRLRKDLEMLLEDVKLLVHKPQSQITNTKSTGIIGKIEKRFLQPKTDQKNE